MKTPGNMLLLVTLISPGISRLSDHSATTKICGFEHKPLPIFEISRLANRLRYRGASKSDASKLTECVGSRASNATAARSSAGLSHQATRDASAPKKAVSKCALTTTVSTG